MRIAYIINSVEGGGAASPVPAIGRVMQDQGAAVRVFALMRRDGRALAPMQDAGLDPLVRAGGHGDHIAALRWLAAQTAAWGATHLWTSLTRATVLGLLLASRRNLPAVCWQHNAYLKAGNRLMLRWLAPRARLWVADSHCVARLTRQRLGIEEDQLCTWPIFAADPAAPVASAWSPGQPLRIGSLGRLHRAKGYDVLIEAMAQLRREGFSPPAPLELTIAGEGAMRPELESSIAAHGLADVIRLPGFTAAPQDFLAGLQLYVQPSRAEGFCIAMHQAMQAGLPVIASAVGEMPYSVVSGATGAIVPANDRGQLAAALRQLLSNPQTLGLMGGAARARVLERYSAGNFATAGRTILSRIAG